MTNDTLSVQDLDIKYYINGHARDIYRDFTIDFSLGSRNVILGKSGSGKSTLLNSIIGIEKFSGSISVPESFLNFGIVPQSQNLLPWRSTVNNIILGCQLSNIYTDYDFLNRILFDLDLHNAASLYPHQLSGGMVRKTLIARALLTRPRTLMLDEPLTNLDYPQRMFLLDFIDKYILAASATLLMVTHDVEEAVALADRIIVIDGCPAKVVLDVENRLRRENPAVTPSKLRESAEFAALANKLWGALEKNVQ